MTNWTITLDDGDGTFVTMYDVDEELLLNRVEDFLADWNWKP